MAPFRPSSGLGLTVTFSDLRFTRCFRGAFQSTLARWLSHNPRAVASALLFAHFTAALSIDSDSAAFSRRRAEQADVVRAT
jgi:hypothetical protein